MPTRNVVLTDHQASLLDRLVASGRYQNASEAMRAGLRLLEEDEERVRRVTEYLDELLADPRTHEIIDEPWQDVIERVTNEVLERNGEKRHAG
ncbi:type II toxin-antitoxin system ParD family antitoxin [Pseudoroseicyclus sp. CXY001]|uniref:type II toxin-antitoxin system ParD family antitoxin n=1 Tax=Pseudoroseicyclus sp. CXY001 TaxID=3242492 RepID=UPI00358DCC7D